ncbi:hypothetical protein [Candidatus Tokpelaia sp.]|uniref:hypothetical protein n=1 Tax=Candidatus Tokpelaia sp. TaxID=2233777 RepID=UPI00123C1A74|nr:hypothetical protein [Candidatus Tokpelaia sp.]KAA6404566.1 hypothetical protein DPQ22_09320 [Candidatus Tokpelaia sp.]
MKRRESNQEAGSAERATGTEDKEAGSAERATGTEDQEARRGDRLACAAPTGTKDKEARSNFVPRKIADFSDKDTKSIEKPERAIVGRQPREDQEARRGDRLACAAPTGTEDKEAGRGLVWQGSKNQAARKAVQVTRLKKQGQEQRACRRGRFLGY